MDDDIKNSILSPADLALVTKAADVLVIDALTLTEANPTLAIGSLSLALACAGALAKIPIEVLLAMITMQYTNQVLIEAGRLLEETAENSKNTKDDKDLN